MLINNKKSQAGIIGAIMLFIVFLIVYFIWLGGFVAGVGRNVVATNQMTGVEAFFFYNLNFVILTIMILAVMGYTYYGAMQQ